MKTLICVAFFSFFLSSCTEDPYLVPASEIPKWLQDRITQDEKVLKSDPDAGPSITSWIRYEYNESWYFEFHNMVWSSGPWYYDFDGNLLKEPAFYLDYNLNKCCKKLVWKGPNYIGD